MFNEMVDSLGKDFHSTVAEIAPKKRVKVEGVQQKFKNNNTFGIGAGFPEFVTGSAPKFGVGGTN